MSFRFTDVIFRDNYRNVNAKRTVLQFESIIAPISPGISVFCFLHPIGLLFFVWMTIWKKKNVEQQFLSGIDVLSLSFQVIGFLF